MSRRCGGCGEIPLLDDYPVRRREHGFMWFYFSRYVLALIVGAGLYRLYLWLDSFVNAYKDLPY